MVYITGDTHGCWDKREQFLQFLTKEDIVICLGDLGWSWDINHINGFCPNATWLSVLGNHENYDLIEKMPIIELYGGKVRKMKENVFYLMNGEMYEIEGKKYLVFGGALSIDKQWRTPYRSWWPQEQPTKGDLDNALKNLEKQDWKFDYLLTHTGDPEQVQTVLGTRHTVNDNTEKMIQEIKYQIKEHNGHFDCHMFGHLHCLWVQQNFDMDYIWYCLYTQIYDPKTKNIKSF